MGATKTSILLAGMTALFLAIGYAMGGSTGMWIALVVALAINAFSYWNSDKIVLRTYRAQPVEKGHFLHKMVEDLAKNAEIPKPKIYMMENEQPNAFATGRNPEHAAVAVTTGIMRLLDKDELAGVIAHELAHIKNRDTLTMTITATISGAIGMLARFSNMFGSHGRNRRGGNPLFAIIGAVVAPMAAMFVQMAISRTREYEADRIGAEISGKPLALARALQKISGIAPITPNYRAEQNPATAHMFIFNPLNFGGLRKLFSTHPDPKLRVQKLMEMAEKKSEKVRFMT